MRVFGKIALLGNIRQNTHSCRTTAYIESGEIMLGLIALLSNLLLFSGFVRNENRFPHPLPREKEEELVKAYKNGDRAARDELINHNMRLIVHIAKKYSAGADVEELVSVGAIGLIKAVENYTAGRGTHLATYAAKCIENEILMSLRKNKKFKGDKSLYEPVGFDKDGNEVALIELLAQDEESVLGKVENKILREKLTALVKNVLSGREYDIVVMRYGLDGDRQFTQNEIAEKWGISRSYVSRIEKKALFRLRIHIEQNGLKF